MDYVGLIGADVNRNSPEILERLPALLKLIDGVLENLPAMPAISGNPVPTAWDPALATAMLARGLAVDDRMAGRGERAGQVLHTEPGQSAPVLHHDRRCGRVP